MSINLKNIKTYTDGKATFLVGLLEQMGLPQIIDNHMTSDFGRPPEIPYSVLAQMMLVNLCDDHHPLSRLSEYYEYKNLEAIFNYPVTLSQINDDRFGGFLDLGRCSAKLLPTLSFDMVLRFKPLTLTPLPKSCGAPMK